MPLGRTVGVDSAEESIVSGLGKISKNNESSLGLIYTQVIKPKVGVVAWVSSPWKHGQDGRATRPYQLFALAI